VFVAVDAIVDVADADVADVAPTKGIHRVNES
jgi:hypothetical protein